MECRRAGPAVTLRRKLFAETMLILNMTRETVVCERAVIADRPLARLRGLIGRGAMAAGEGLLLRPAPSIHTAFMRFPIDVLFLDNDLNVLKVVEALKPWRTAAARRARATLELPAGELAEREVEVGDRLGILESGQRARMGKAPGGTEEPASTRVLLVGSDRRFRSVAAALLTQRGCAVSYSERVLGVAELARCEQADVVVLDAGVSLTSAAREAARIDGLHLGVGVVVVGDEPEDSLAAMPVQAKWGSFDALYEAIVAAGHRAAQGI
jgi:uncharacterized membrane protein (UPF0127 family)